MEVRIVDNSDKVIEAKDNAIAAALENIGVTMERHAKEQCPVDTGLLRNSITHAVSGHSTAIKAYHASYGSNRHKSGKNAGKRISASSKNAGSVGYGRYSGGAVGAAGEEAVYVGSNVVYARKQEIGNYKHQSGAAHFLRDAATTHNDEYERIAMTQLKKAGLA